MRQEHCHPSYRTCGAPAGCHGYSCRASLHTLEIMLIDDANEMHDYDFYDDYPPAIIYGIIMMIITLTRSTDVALGSLSQSGVCFCVSMCVKHWEGGCIQTKCNGFPSFFYSFVIWPLCFCCSQQSKTRCSQKTLQPPVTSSSNQT